eukprot:358186-Amphidinium_carterae.1
MRVHWPKEPYPISQAPTNADTNSQNKQRCYLLRVPMRQTSRLLIKWPSIVGIDSFCCRPNPDHGHTPYPKRAWNGSLNSQQNWLVPSIDAFSTHLAFTARDDTGR